MMNYVASLHEGILEAHTGIVTGFKSSEKGSCHLVVYSSFVMHRLLSMSYTYKIEPILCMFNF